MSLIDATYFTGELNIANTDDASVAELVQLYTDKHENNYLTLLLGKSIATAFLAGLQLDPIPQQWTDLKNELLVINGTSKVSPIANYVYFYFIRRQTYSSSGTGMTQPTHENAVNIDSKIETSRAWNEMNKLSFEVYKFLRENVATYGKLPYDLRFYNADYLLAWFDWSYWWGYFPFAYRRMIPEIYRPIGPNN